MNWESPQIRKSLKELRETLRLEGRDSRVVRASFAYSQNKKRLAEHARQFVRGVFGTKDKDPGRLRVFFWLPGGLGDAACARRLVSAYRELMPGAEFEIFSPVPDAAQTVFADFSDVVFAPSAAVYWKNYDLVVCACLTVKFLHADEKRLDALAPQFMPVFNRARAAQQSLGGLLDDPFLTEPALGRWLLKEGGRRFDLLSFLGGVTLPHDARERLTFTEGARKKFGLENIRYVTFHDGTGRKREGNSSGSRAWPRERWQEFIRLFKNTFAEIKLVQLGGKDDPAYPEADKCLAGKTRLTDLPDILSGALCHIDTESGLVHLAQYLAVRSVVLFGPSDAAFFAYDKNKKLSAGDCGGCMWMTADWMERCSLGYSQSPCMEAISPECVLSAVKELLTPLKKLV